MNYKITDKVIYRTIHWTVETENDTYYVQCQEDELYDFWYITSEEDGVIESDSELGQDLIKACEVYEDFDMEGMEGNN